MQMREHSEKLLSTVERLLPKVGEMELVSVMDSADAVVEKSSFMVVIFTRSPVEMEPVSVQEDLKPRQM